MNRLAMLAMHASTGSESGTAAKRRRLDFRSKSKKAKRLAASNVSIRQALNCYLGSKITQAKRAGA
jgi:hypothetical protein